MRHKSWMLLEAAEAWCAMRLDAAPPDVQPTGVRVQTPPADQAAQLAAWLIANAYAGEDVLLAIGSQHCLVAEIPLEAGRRRPSRSEMAYALEEHLPLAAEDCVAEFVVRPATEHAFGVAVPKTYLAALVEGLEDNGVRVASVVPVGLLRCQQLVSEQGRADGTVIVANRDSLDVFVLQEGFPRQWQIVPHRPRELTRHLQWLRLQQGEPVRVLAVGIDDAETAAALSEQADVTRVAAEAGDESSDLVGCGHLMAQGEPAPWLDFRRTALPPRDRFRTVRPALQFAVAAAAVFLVAMSASFLFRASRFERLARDYEDQQRDVFRQALPNQPVPAGIRSRLESEHHKLAGVAGEQAAAPDYLDALSSLFDILCSLPQAVRFRLLEVQIEDDGRLSLEGEAPNHGDAGILATSLRQGGLDVEQPFTRQLRQDGVSVNIKARAVGSEIGTSAASPPEGKS